MSLQGIYLASRALNAHQRALETTGQNVANANTPGYSRQVVSLKSVSATDSTTLSGVNGGVGGGVDASIILRSHASWLDRSADTLRAQVGDATVASQLAARIEGLTGEPSDTGLQATLDRFFTAFQAAADRPNDTTLRSAATRAAGQVADRFQQSFHDLDAVKRETMEGIRSNVSQVNSLTKQIAGLSRVIGASQAGGQPASELLDQRDELLNQLTQLTGAQVAGRESGAVVVSIGGVTLIQDSDAQAIQLGTDGNLSLADGTRVATSVGELGARLQALQTQLPEHRNSLSAIRDTLAIQVNQLHTGAKDRSGTAGVAIFVFDSGGEMSVNSALQGDPNRLALGDGSAGDGAVAGQIAQLRNHPGILPAYQTLVGELATRVAATQQRQDMAQASLTQVQTMQSSESGVNLDEELATMVAQQHIYAASARLLSTYDQMLDTLIQRTGV
nr:flagellar hook-associated protein FlgK [Armatimonas sp.]